MRANRFMQMKLSDGFYLLYYFRIRIYAPPARERLLKLNTYNLSTYVK